MYVFANSWEIENAQLQKEWLGEKDAAALGQADPGMHVREYLRANSCACVHVCVCVCACMCMCVCVCACACAFIACEFACACAFTCSCMCACMCAH